MESMTTVELNDTTEYTNIIGFQAVGSSLSFGDQVELKITNNKNEDVTLNIFVGVIYPATAKKFFLTGSNSDISLNIFTI